MNVDTYLTVDGYLDVPTGRVWYQSVGERTERPPLLLLHGGPGFNSAYLEPFEAIAATGRQVIRYDQIGSGRSPIEEPPDRLRFTVSMFEQELRYVRDALGLDVVHLLGQSWGGMLALEHVLAGASGIQGMIIESSPASEAEWAAETMRLVSELPAAVKAVLDRHIEAGTTDCDEFAMAYSVYERRHVLMIDPPPWEARANELFAQDHAVYDMVNGGVEFATTAAGQGAGTDFAGWDVRHRLHEIVVPTLLLSGRFDEATPAIMQTLLDGIAGSRWVLMEHSSHSCHSEETSRTIAAVADFLATVDAGNIAARK
jgi:L-proline amide hydrolase